MVNTALFFELAIVVRYNLHEIEGERKVKLTVKILTAQVKAVWSEVHIRGVDKEKALPNFLMSSPQL